MPEAPGKLDLRSLDRTEDKRQELLRLFPEIRTEGGRIDFDRLKLALGAAVDAGKERYGVHWPGKADCYRTIQAPALGTLCPCPEEGESVNWDSTENLILEGDNLEVLKLLQKAYLGQVKLIYLDPPYNTGNDFIYPDNYSESLQTYLEYTGQVDAQGRKFGTNTDREGRFHSKWMNMMYPRLSLARNLLREDGFMIVSIDDAELQNLRALLNEALGEENFIATLVFDRNRKNDAKLFSVGHEYMVVYARNKAFLSEKKLILRAPKEGVDEVRDEFARLRALHHDDWPLVAKGLRVFFNAFGEDDPRLPLARYTKVDEKGPYRTDGDPSWPGGGGPTYDVQHPGTRLPCKKPQGGWRFPTPERFWEEHAQGRIVFGADETTMPSVRRNLFEKDVQVMRSVTFSYAQKATQDFESLFGGLPVFDNPKSYKDIQRLVGYLTDPDDLVLDFFAGSGTTFHGVLLANEEDGGNRKCILVQLPEPVTADTEAGRNALSLGLGTVAEITKERARRAIQASPAKPGSGFRVFKLKESNFKLWDAGIEHESGALVRQLELYIDHIREGRSDQDLLFEILLKRGFPLTTPVARLTLAGQEVYRAAGGRMLVCLGRDLNLDLVRAMAEAAPECAVFLDEGFAGNDQLKTNAVQIFKTKGTTKFLTV